MLIEAEEANKPTEAPVSGFDLTFSVPKSVSTVWAVADGETQALIAQAHHAVIHDIIELLERDVAMTRIGAEGPRGAVAQLEAQGVIATAYDHYDSRAADPQLHTHIVVATESKPRMMGSGARSIPERSAPLSPGSRNATTLCSPTTSPRPSVSDGKFASNGRELTVLTVPLLRWSANLSSIRLS